MMNTTSRMMTGYGMNGKSLPRPICENVGFARAKEYPPEITNPKPRMTSWLASVTTKGNILNLATNMPFTKPSKPQIAIAAMHASRLLPVKFSTTPIVVLARASIAPMERSIPPAVMTNTMPSASTPLIETDTRMLIRLLVFKKLGEANIRITNMPSMTNTMPYRFMKILRSC